MPRHKNIRPTSIYWLLDIRPETTAGGWPSGKPFYCGKTVRSPEHRLRQHRCKRTSKVSVRLLKCGDFIKMKIVEIVPANQGWVEREQFWIRTLRELCPDCLNISNGGEGPAGIIFSAEVRARMSAAQTGMKHTPERIAKSASSRRGMKRSPEAIAKSAASRRGKKHSPEARTKMRNSHLGKNNSPEARTKLSVAHRGKSKSPEHIANLVKAWKRDRTSRLQKLPSRMGITHSPETRAKLSAAHTGRKLPEEQKAKIRESCRRTAALRMSASLTVMSPRPQHQKEDQ